VNLTVLLLLLMGLGGHNLYRYTWLWFGAFQAIALDCMRRSAPETAEETTDRELNNAARSWEAAYA
jgi:hypothetical protein